MSLLVSSSACKPSKPTTPVLSQKTTLNNSTPPKQRYILVLAVKGVRASSIIDGWAMWKGGRGNTNAQNLDSRWFLKILDHVCVCTYTGSAQQIWWVIRFCQGEGRTLGGVCFREFELLWKKLCKCPRLNIFEFKSTHRQDEIFPFQYFLSRLIISIELDKCRIRSKSKNPKIQKIQKNKKI